MPIVVLADDRFDPPMWYSLVLPIGCLIVIFAVQKWDDEKMRRLSESDRGMRLAGVLLMTFGGLMLWLHLFFPAMSSFSQSASFQISRGVAVLSTLICIYGVVMTVAGKR